MKTHLFKALGLVLAVYASSAFAADEIKFLKATSFVSSKYGQAQQTVRFEATVENLAFAKQVYAHVQRADGVWVDIALAYNRPAEATREVWSAVYSPELNTSFDLRFALKYVANGQVYWDNNDGQNYFLAQDSGSKLADGLTVYNADYQATARLAAGDQYLFGSATLKNLSPNKLVRVHYSVDNWEKTEVALASFSPSYWAGSYSSASNPNQYGFEEWSFALNVGSADQVDYAIEFLHNGQSYWDNNFGRNYRTQIVRQ